MRLSPKVSFLVGQLVHSFFHLLIQQVLRTWYVPGIMQGAGNRGVSNIDMVSVQSLNKY